MLSFVEIQKFTPVDELADIVQWDSQYNSMVFAVPTTVWYSLSHCITNPFPDIIIRNYPNGNSGVLAKHRMGLRKTCGTCSSNPNANPLDNRAVRLKLRHELSRALTTKHDRSGNYKKLGMSHFQNVQNWTEERRCEEIFESEKSPVWCSCHKCYNLTNATKVCSPSRPHRI